MRAGLSIQYHRREVRIRHGHRGWPGPVQSSAKAGPGWGSRVRSLELSLDTSLGRREGVASQRKVSDCSSGPPRLIPALSIARNGPLSKEGFSHQLYSQRWLWHVILPSATLCPITKNLDKGQFLPELGKVFIEPVLAHREVPPQQAQPCRTPDNLLFQPNPRHTLLLNASHSTNPQLSPRLQLPEP